MSPPGIGPCGGTSSRILRAELASTDLAPCCTKTTLLNNQVQLLRKQLDFQLRPWSKRVISPVGFMDCIHPMPRQSIIPLGVAAVLSARIQCNCLPPARRPSWQNNSALRTWYRAHVCVVMRVMPGLPRSHRQTASHKSRWYTAAFLARPSINGTCT